MIPRLFYFRLIAGFIGMAVIAGGSVFLSQYIWPDRSPSDEPSISVLVMFVINTVIFCVVAWKVLQGYKRRRES